MTCRAATVEEIEAALNREEVLRAFHPTAPWISMGAFYSRPGNVALRSVEHPDALALFCETEPGRYELHYLCGPQARGKIALEVLREMFNQIFTLWKARVIFGATPRDNRAARSMNRLLGGLPVGSEIDDQGRECIVYELEASRWAELLEKSPVV